MLRRAAPMVLLMAGMAWGMGQDAGPVASGPKVGAVLPSAFDALTINGKVAPNRPHCLVCEFQFDPVVLVFAREQNVDKDGAFTGLLTRLDELAGKEKEWNLHVAVVFLSPDAGSSAFNPKEADANKLADEARARDALLARLQLRAANLKNVILACYPDPGPLGWSLNSQADVTALYYFRQKVAANAAWTGASLTDQESDRFLSGVKDMLHKAPKSLK